MKVIHVTMEKKATENKKQKTLVNLSSSSENGIPRKPKMYRLYQKNVYNLKCHD